MSYKREREALEGRNIQCKVESALYRVLRATSSVLAGMRHAACRQVGMCRFPVRLHIDRADRDAM